MKKIKKVVEITKGPSTKYDRFMSAPSFSYNQLKSTEQWVYQTLILSNSQGT